MVAAAAAAGTLAGGDRKQDKAQYSEHADELLAHHRCTPSQTGKANMAAVTRKLHTPGSASSIFQWIPQPPSGGWPFVFFPLVRFFTLCFPLPLACLV